jgi:hypothetical protein
VILAFECVAEVCGEPEKGGAARFGTLFPNRVANRAEALTMRRAFIENKADG